MCWLIGCSNDKNPEILIIIFNCVGQLHAHMAKNPESLKIFAISGHLIGPKRSHLDVDHPKCLFQPFRICQERMPKPTNESLGHLSGVLLLRSITESACLLRKIVYLIFDCSILYKKECWRQLTVISQHFWIAYFFANFSPSPFF